ncbi:MAG: ATP-binding protein [Alsobacter sp.]
MAVKKTLREQLGELLTADQPDYDRIAVLTAQLLEADTSRARFSVDAGVVARLGRELVARHETALSELVKNAYDADAQRVDVHIAGPVHGDFIEVSDDGSGISHEALTQGFMRLATTSKLDQPLSPVFRRRRAGRKGVGRFAAERLGRRLILTTATAAADEALQIDIEWSRFEAGRDLASISVPVTTLPKSRPQGTTLRIEGLRDGWPPAAVERTFKHVLDLIDPGDQTAEAGTSSDFFVQFRADGRSVAVVDTRTQVARYAFAVIEAEIDLHGNALWSLRCERLGIDISRRPLRFGENEASRAEAARRAKLKAYYFILERSNFPPTVYQTVQSYLAANGGVRVYRNGFRVPPYGQTGDDWLELDHIAARRSRTLAPMRNRNFLGSVSLDDESGLFEETSSREGLIESPALDELVAVMQAAILTGVREVDAERQRQQLKRVRPPSVGPSDPLPPTAGLAATGQASDGELGSIVRDATQRAQSLAVNLGDNALRTAVDELARVAAEAAERAQQRAALLREIDLLRVLASMGLAVGQFTHEFSTLSGAMRAALATLTESGRTDAERLEAVAGVRLLLDQARAFSGLFKSMTEDNALRERLPLDLYQATTAFRTALRSVLERNSVTMEVDDEGEEVLSPPMHRSELFAILLNFTTNSIKAVKRAGREGHILVALSRTARGGAVIEFSDNGDGVAEHVRDTMFDAFVTTTAANARAQTDEEMAIGSGLGLAIVRDVVTAAGGTVELAEAAPPYATCLRVELPPGMPE